MSSARGVRAGAPLRWMKRKNFTPKYPPPVSGLSKIEGGLVYIHDYQVQIFALVFRVPAVTFVLTLDLSKPVDETLSRFIYNEKRGLAPKPHKLFDAAAFAASGKAA